MRAEVLKRCWWGYLAILIHKFGGVSGAVSRIVSAWPGDFTCQQIERTLQALYPGLTPNEHQVADCFEWMRRRKMIEIVHDGEVKVYRRAVKAAFQPVESKPQLTFGFQA